MTKKDAYGWLAFKLQTPMSQAHIGYLSEYYCNLIMEECSQLFKKHRWKLKIRPERERGGYNVASQ
jgi:hypothetical protein